MELFSTTVPETLAEIVNHRLPAALLPISKAGLTASVAAQLSTDDRLRCQDSWPAHRRHWLPAAIQPDVHPPAGRVLIIAYLGVKSEYMGNFLRQHLAAFKLGLAGVFAGLGVMVMMTV